MSRWSLIIALMTCALARAESRTYVVIVGNNESVEPGTKALQYADDDAAKFFELFTAAASRVELLTVMDVETQRLHPGISAKALAPTKKQLFEVLTRYNRQIADDVAEGHETTLYFVYVGHGHVGASGQGYVSFLDGPLTGDELWDQVVARSAARFNHLILDACNSYLMVASRGDDERGPDASAAIKSYIDARSLSRFPNTGVVVSTSTAKETHEWSVFQGGVFSQEVRSGLSGAADINADGRVEYSELEAFLAAANLAVDDPKARLQAHVRAPRLDVHRPLVDLESTKFEHMLRLPAAFSGRFHLEDARGVRYVDGNKTSENEVYVALVKSPYYFIRTEDAEARVALTARGTVDLRSLRFIKATQASRGSVAEAFRDLLFQVPYGPAFYQGYVARTASVPARKAQRPFPPPGLEVRAAAQPFKNPYD